MNVTYNIRFFFSLERLVRKSFNVGFNSSWRFCGVECIVIFWVCIGYHKGTFGFFWIFCVSFPRIGRIFNNDSLFSNVIPFNLRIYFCTYHGVTIFYFNMTWVSHLSLVYYDLGSHNLGELKNPLRCHRKSWLLKIMTTQSL